jgi:deazaflavin-dependent oxidoreductase (nitroreductase family)
LQGTVLRVASQRSSDFDTPSRDEIVGISQKHVSMMAVSDSDDVWVWVGTHHVLLHTIGRRSGRDHQVALPFWRDPDGHRIVVASFAGAPKDPDWFLNVADKTANAEVRVGVQGGSFWAEAQILEGEDYARLVEPSR